MKKVLSLIVLFFAIAMPAFSAQDNTFFIPVLKKDQIKKAIVARSLNSNWQIKQDSNFTLDIYKVKDDAASMFLYGSNYNSHPEDRVHFNLLEKDNGVLITYTAYVVTNPNSGFERPTRAVGVEWGVGEMLKELFLGNTSYYVYFTVKKKYVLISDTVQTTYKNNDRIGRKKKKVIKIDDKPVSEYDKKDLKNLFLYSQKQNLKLETTEEDGNKIYYLIRTYTPPTYKQFL